MSKMLACGDLFEGCAAEVRAETVDDILSQAAVHARADHGLETIDDATRDALVSAIREV